MPCRCTRADFNTILMNVYRSGDDCIGYHRDNETGWAPNTGFATLCFGAERDFLLLHDETRQVTTRLDTEFVSLSRG